MIDSFKNNLLIGLLLLLFSSSSSFASGHFVYSVDESGVYCVTGYGVTLLKGADKDSFQRVGSRESFYGRMDRFAKDQNHVYNFCQRQKGISPVGFDVLHDWELVRTHDQVYYTGNSPWLLLQDLNPNHTVVKKVTLESDPYMTAEIIKDHDTLFYKLYSNHTPFIVPEADPATFKLLNPIFAVDKNHVYYLYSETYKEHFRILPKVDLESFKVSKLTASDKYNYYIYNHQLEAVDVFSKDEPIPNCCFIGDEE